MSNPSPYQLFPLGDSAITIDFGNTIDEAINRQVIALFEAIRNNPLPGMIEAVPAYSSLTIYYDVPSLRKKIPADKLVFELMSEQLQQRLQQPVRTTEKESALIQIPVCYDPEFATDLIQFAAQKNLSPEEVIRIHTEKEYRVYMLGFLPGFSYMGLVDERIAASRKSQPTTVAAGSVGIAGKQTGIYPLASPGGWHIIGRTPLTLFDAKKEEPTLLKAGDRIQFVPISKNECKNY
ncbi:MAG TPA: 5-oxoprolinase subunit PxpB [Chitinophagaceae bacterium]|nr:5-oxoprolinase subunit PxpB [Chitinophagaceae bacterium]